MTLETELKQLKANLKAQIKSLSSPIAICSSSQCKRNLKVRQTDVVNTTKAIQSKEQQISQLQTESQDNDLFNLEENPISIPKLTDAQKTALIVGAALAVIF